MKAGFLATAIRRFVMLAVLLAVLLALPCEASLKVLSLVIFGVLGVACLLLWVGAFEPHIVSLNIVSLISRTVSLYRCPSCSNLVEKDAKYCPGCYAKLKWE